jgi:CxxC-x17-CxxC domain-containing protein
MPKKMEKPKRSQENMPALVIAMTKLVERLEALEKKTDLVLTKISALPAEMRRSPSNVPTPSPSHAAFQGGGSKERILHEAVCADCRKGCKVPFRPNENRPVYCPECWAIRKVGHVPQNPDQGSLVPKEKRVMPVSHPMDPQAVFSKNKKQKPAKKRSSKPAKKKKK